MIVEDVEHLARRRAARPGPADYVPGVRWFYFTLNSKMSDEDLRAYVCGLVIVSQPGALHGPYEHEATQAQRAAHERVSRAMDDARGGGDLQERVLAAWSLAAWSAK